MKNGALGLVIVAVLFPRLLGAQAVTGTILGTITDDTGGILPGATVTLTHTETGRTRVVVADTAGEFTAPSLPTGTYTLLAELQGFKTISIPGIRLGVDQRLRFTVKLEVGAVSETVTVVGASPLVQTSSSELGTTVSEEQIRQLPLNGRNFVSLTRTVPGVVRGIPGANIDGAGSLAWRASASFSANGQRPRDNNYILDGVDNNETWLQTVVIFPAIDALDEFKLQTSTYSAEFGRSLGGVVNVQIKSGANAFKGNAYEFLRNDGFDANNFFNNRAGREKPDFSQHQFGGTLGGPGAAVEDVLLRQLSGLSREPGADLPVDRALGTHAAGRFQRGQPRHLRPADGTALCQESDSVESVGLRGAQRHRAALSSAKHRRRARRDRTDHQQLSDQSDARTRRQPDRLESRSQPERQQPFLRPLQLSEDPSLPAGDAAARRRRLHLRRR